MASSEFSSDLYAELFADTLAAVETRVLRKEACLRRRHWHQTHQIQAEWWTWELTWMKWRVQATGREAYIWRGTPDHPVHTMLKESKREYRHAISFAKKIFADGNAEPSLDTVTSSYSFNPQARPFIPRRSLNPLATPFVPNNTALDEDDRS
ncbi:hypothetical protein PENSPDRAFT_649351 [Peniophora sp. CONT]|nr:hypothetical protein PENSPDRAFT_649351 [Peniophora sp. CONT]